MEAGGWRSEVIFGTIWRGIKRGFPWAVFCVALLIASILYTRLVRGPEYDWVWVARQEILLWAIVPVTTIITFVIGQLASEAFGFALSKTRPTISGLDRGRK